MPADCDVETRRLLLNYRYRPVMLSGQFFYVLWCAGGDDVAAAFAAFGAYVGKFTFLQHYLKQVLLICEHFIKFAHEKPKII